KAAPEGFRDNWRSSTWRRPSRFQRSIIHGIKSDSQGLFRSPPRAVPLLSFLARWPVALLRRRAVARVRAINGEQRNADDPCDAHGSRVPSVVVKVHLVDGTFELFRAYYGAPPRKNQRGREVGAARGLFGSLLKLLRDDQVTHIGCAFDHVIE